MPASQTRKLEAGWLLLGAGGAAALAVLAVFDPRQHAFYPTCLFHSTTGLLCPGCGSLRALHELLRGHLATALRFNPLLIISMPFVAWWGARPLTRWMRGEPATLALRPIWIWTFLAVTLAFGICRNLPGAPLGALPQ
jgi:hypothetical protein